mgnify:CR=1 FL=1
MNRCRFAALLSVALSVFLGLVAAAGVAGAGEDGDGAAPAEAAPGRGREAEKARLKEIARKVKAGEELTAEERALAEKARARLGKDPRNAREGREGPGGAVEGLELVNAVDAVGLQLAQSLLRAEKSDEAVKVLEKLAAATRDRTAAGYAHLALARIHRSRNDQAGCDAELRKVTGPAVAGALAMLAGPDKASAAKLEELLKAADEPLAKALIIRHLAAVYARGGDLEKLADLSARAAKLLTYEEALAARAEEDRLRERQAAGRPGLPAGGAPWMRPGGGPGGPGAEGEAEPRKGAAAGREGNAEGLRKEIKELEEAGMLEEAEALKKQLKALEERPARKAVKLPRKGGEPMPNDGEDVF